MRAGAQAYLIKPVNPDELKQAVALLTSVIDERNFEAKRAARAAIREDCAIRHMENIARILTVDIGGSSVKVLASGQTEPRKRRSGKKLTPVKMVEIVRELAKGWDYEAISIGYPGLVGDQGPSSEPSNLGDGWVGFDYPSAFGLPVRIMNDAAMQALGSYEGGRMLFIGLGTGVGSALIMEEVILTLELGQLPYKRGETLGETLGRQGLKRLGKAAWRRAVMDVAPALMKTFLADSIVIGGGNAKKLKKLPPGVRLGHNLTAFRGGFRMWNI